MRHPLNRALSKLGLASRAEARRLIAEGRVTVDGVTTGGVVHGRAYQCVPTFGLDMRVQQEGA